MGSFFAVQNGKRVAGALVLLTTLAKLVRLLDCPDHLLRSG
jgi:hypothetical protein